MSDVVQLDMLAILKRLPHRHPFLLVDRVLECHPKKSIRALKNVTYNEPFFPGHFPGRPVMPGVLVIEALAQTAGILTFVTAGIIPDENTIFYFVGIDKARFRRPVVPGRPAHPGGGSRARHARHLVLQRPRPGRGAGGRIREIMLALESGG